MKKREYYTLFKLFLEMNEAKGSYDYYLSKARMDSGVHEKMKWSDYPSSGWIMLPFSWRNTRQGRDYWSDLNGKWLRVLDQVGERLRAEAIPEDVAIPDLRTPRS